MLTLYTTQPKSFLITNIQINNRYKNLLEYRQAQYMRRGTLKKIIILRQYPIAFYFT